MMNEILSQLPVFFLAGLAAVFTQNVIFGRAMGLEQLACGEKRRPWMSFLFCVAGSCLFWLAKEHLLPLLSFLEFFVPSYYARAFLWPLFIVLAMLAVYLPVLLIFERKGKKGAETLPFACFSTFLAGVMLVSASRDYSFPEMLGFAAGSGIGYCLAGFLADEGRKKLEASGVPEAFSGLPATLIYLAGLALAAYSVIGHKLSGLL